MKKILFLSLVLSLLLSLSFAQDNKIKQKVGDKEGSKITEYGINKNQPISVGDCIYKRNPQPSLSLYEITEYFYDGVENNLIKIRRHFYHPLDMLSTSQKTLIPQEVIKQASTKFQSSFSVPLNPEKQATLEVNESFSFSGSSGCKLLLIRIADDSNRILVNEIEVKRESSIFIEEKPVIYLYPTKEQKVSVRLEYQGNIIVSYPKYDETVKGWDVVAYPDGRIVNLSDGKEYSYLFWEGLPTTPVEYDFSKGFVVKGEDMAIFLQKTLALIGLSPREYNEFIVYWLPRMQNNKYNLIHFATKEYEEVAKLDITPKPDAILRVFMAFKPLNDKINIESQEIKPFKREGFTVVEWGGTGLK